MLTYLGNSPYCYANSAAMLLKSVGESVEPRLVEVLTGVGLGAFWLAESQTLFLSGWASPPDLGVTRSFQLLGFEVAEEAEANDGAIPVKALEMQLQKGPVMLGPLDLGELSYHPNACGATGVDHFVLAIAIDDGTIVVHDPAGYPATPIEVDALCRAWRADRIGYRRGAYRRWHSPVRVESPTPRQIADAAIRSFQLAYRDARAMSVPRVTVGPEAIKQLLASIRNEELREDGLRHLQEFALALGVRRALDYSWYLRESNPELADLKSRQASHLGHAHAVAVQLKWDSLAHHLMHLADLEHRFETAVTVEAD